MIGLKTVIRTRDFETSVSFYTQLLNLEMIEDYKDEDGVKGVILQIGKSNNAFIEISEIVKTNMNFQSSFAQKVKSDKVSLQIETSDIKSWSSKLKDKCEFKGPVLKPWGYYYLYLRDPDGIQIIIYQKVNNR